MLPVRSMSLDKVPRANHSLVVNMLEGVLRALRPIVRVTRVAQVDVPTLGASANLGEVRGRRPLVVNSIALVVIPLAPMVLVPALKTADDPIQYWGFYVLSSRAERRAFWRCLRRDCVRVAKRAG